MSLVEPGNNDCPTEDALISAVQGNAVIDPKLLSQCIHCGLCLPACPTYLATGREMESPRGRIYLMSQWQQGNQPLSSRMAEHLESCLGCLGCQTACPSGVAYEKLLNQCRPHLVQMQSRPVREFKRFIFSSLLPDYPRLKMVGAMLKLWQSSGGQTMLSKIPWFKNTFLPLQQWQDLLPAIPVHVPLPKQAWKSGPKQGQVALFIGCVMDIFYNHVNHACHRLLMQQGQVVLVPEQTCCGALAFHAGEKDIAVELAKTNIKYFESNEDPVVVTSAGCGAMLKSYHELFVDDPEWLVRAKQFSQRVKDISEILLTGKFISRSKKMEGKVAYHAACHLAHAQNIHNAPQELLSSIEGIELIQLNEAEHCCGSAGIFNLTHEKLSQEILQRKIEFLKETEADVVVTTNPGCMLQIETGLRKAGMDMEVKHLAELLDEAYCD